MNWVIQEAESMAFIWNMGLNELGEERIENEQRHLNN